MKKILLISIMLIPVIVFAQEVSREITFWDKTKGFLSDIDGFNIALLAFAAFFGGLWAMGRAKIKMIGELFLKAYEYTDDKRLSKAERQDLMQRFLAIIGKTVNNTTVVDKKKK